MKLFKKGLYLIVLLILAVSVKNSILPIKADDSTELTLSLTNINNVEDYYNPDFIRTNMEWALWYGVSNPTIDSLDVSFTIKEFHNFIDIDFFNVVLGFVSCEFENLYLQMYSFDNLTLNFVYEKSYESVSSELFAVSSKEVTDSYNLFLTFGINIKISTEETAYLYWYRSTGLEINLTMKMGGESLGNPNAFYSEEFSDIEANICDNQQNSRQLPSYTLTNLLIFVSFIVLYSKRRKI